MVVVVANNYLPHSKKNFKREQLLSKLKNSCSRYVHFEQLLFILEQFFRVYFLINNEFVVSFYGGADANISNLLYCE